MNINLGSFALYFAIVGLFVSISLYWFYKIYNTSKSESKEIDNSSDLISSKVFELITHFQPSVKIRIADKVDEIPKVALFHKNPTYIIVSSLVLGQLNDDSMQFKDRHLVALVAHELGHIELSSLSKLMMEICVSGFVGALAIPCLQFCLWPFLATTNWTYSLYAVFVLTFFAVALSLISRVDEYCADAFAIKNAEIPAIDLIEALKNLEYYCVEHPDKISSRITHPSVDCRIRKIKAFQGQTKNSSR